METRDGRRWVRFSTLIANRGPGPLEIAQLPIGCGWTGDVLGTRHAVQRVFWDVDGNGLHEPPLRGPDVGYTQRDAGCTRFHPAHEHWHLDDFSSYSLTTRTGAAASATKVSFCVRDDQRVERPPPGTAPFPRYVGCDSVGEQGISVGWIDLYDSSLPDQALPIPAGDGAYCLAIVSDPANRIAERNELNNAVGFRITIDGPSVSTGGRCRPTRAGTRPGTNQAYPR